MARLTPERLVTIVADADAMGVTEAARVHGVTPRTVRRYRKKVEADPELSARVRSKRQAVEAVADERRLDWARKREQLIEVALDRMITLIGESKDLHAVAGAYKLVGDHHITAGALFDGEPTSADQPGGSAPPAPGQAPGGGARPGSTALH